MLRASGTEFNVDQFLRASSFSPNRIFRKGEKKFPTTKTINEFSGFNLVVSEASGDDIEQQFKEAIVFLNRYETDLKNLKQASGLEDITLDFGVNLRIGYDDCYWPSIRLPKELVSATGKLELEIEFSFYPDVNPTYQETPDENA